MKNSCDRKIAGLLLLSLTSGGCAVQTELSATAPLRKNDALVIWWERGYYAQEDGAIRTVIDRWEAKTGNSVELSLLDQDVVLRETQNALQTGQIPDIVLSYEGSYTFIPTWAWNGQLADVSSVTDSLKDSYSDSALKSAELYNNVAQTQTAYAVPLKQHTIHIHYWRDLLAKAGFNEADIPTEWNAFWNFWKQAQDRLHAQGQTDIYGLGLAMSREASDTFANFNQVLEAFDVRLLDNNGDLLVDNPQVRQQITAALDWYTQFYKEGYVPTDATDRIDSSNNIAFLNRKLLMVVNPTLSIPGSQREDDQDLYLNQLATIEFPNEPDGESPTYVVNVPQLVVLAKSPNQEMAKNFITYLMQPDNLAPYLEGSLGRFFPVMPELATAPFWNNPADPHIFMGTQQFQTGTTRAGYHSLSPAYSEVDIQNIWGQAIESVVIDHVSPEEATDEALLRIQAIFADWKR